MPGGRTSDFTRARRAATGGRAWVLLSRRSPYVQHGGTWSCSGGAADEGETPWQAAVREASEEISGIEVNPVGIAGQHVWTCPAQCGWSYTTFLVIVPLHAAGRLPRVRVAVGGILELRIPAGLDFQEAGKRNEYRRTDQGHVRRHHRTRKPLAMSAAAPWLVRVSGMLP